MLTLFTYNLWAQNANTEAAFSGSCRGITVRETLDYISTLTGVKFAYTSLSVDEKKLVNFTFNNLTVPELLEIMHEHTDLKPTILGNQVLLKAEAYKPKKYLLSGIVFEQDSITPVSYAAVSVSGRAVGTIADVQGRFEFELTDEFSDDTLAFSMMGYEPYIIPVRSFISHPGKLIVLQTAVYEIKPVKISSKDFKKVTVGNSRNIPAGSLYMDTNGQQAALLVENDKGIDGKLLTVNYYLSASGNTDAPFRVRLYAVDTITGEPGNDMINEIIVVKPDIKRGWYGVDIRKFDICVPENGFFIAMEGVFPNNYDFYTGDDGFIDLTGGNQVIEDDAPVSIIYGQRLGYSRNRKDKNNTWHYSLSHTWFQLKRQPFGIMVSAEVQVRKNKRNERTGR
ncbi:MAG: carboxypeptidase-like regulatory domain-containing protein [Bacteroidales bacterium]|nr:carboxypeptidase-like regulatory domain-containing protein [Bacteroidales bacterium]